MSVPRRRRTAAGVGVLVFALGACGGGDGVSEQEYVDALAEAMTSAAAGGQPLTTDASEARCAAERVVAEVGQRRLEDAGLTIDRLADPFASGTGLTAAEADAVVDAILECVAVGASFALQFTGEEALDADADCLAGRFEESGAFRGFLARSLREGRDAAPTGELGEELSDIILDCVEFGAVFAQGLGVDLTEAEIACLDDAIRRSETLRELLAEGLAGGATGTEVPPEVVDMLVECVPASKLAGAGG